MYQLFKYGLSTLTVLGLLMFTNKAQAQSSISASRVNISNIGIVRYDVPLANFGSTAHGQLIIKPNDLPFGLEDIISSRLQLIVPLEYFADGLVFFDGDALGCVHAVAPISENSFLLEVSCSELQTNNGFHQ